MAFFARSAHVFGAAARALGKGVDKLGLIIEGEHGAIEKLRPATRVLPHKSVFPTLATQCFVAPTASVIGDVELGKGVSIWYGAVVRGDVHHIKIGEGSSIGDGATVHVAKFGGDYPTIIGAGVTVGPKAIVHACTLEDGCHIGAGATVLDGAKVEQGAILAAGALVPPRSVIPAGQVWAGVPAAYLRKTTPQETAALAATAVETSLLAATHAAETAKTGLQVAEEVELREDTLQRETGEWGYPQKDGNAVVEPYDVGGMGVPGEIFNNALRPGPDWETYEGDTKHVAAARESAEKRSRAIFEQAQMDGWEGKREVPALNELRAKDANTQLPPKASAAAQ